MIDKFELKSCEAYVMSMSMIKKGPYSLDGGTSVCTRNGNRIDARGMTGKFCKD